MIFLKLSENGRELNHYKFDQDVVSIGTDPGNDVCLLGGGIGRRHAKILAATLQLLAVDDGGATLLNGERTASARLENGDVIAIGGYRIRFYHSQHVPGLPGGDAKTWKVTRKEPGEAAAPDADGTAPPSTIQL